MAKRLNKNDIVRGRIFDMLAEQFGNSVLGVYDGKLRIEIIDEETDEVVQFSLAPVVHKTLIDDSECDKYVSIKDKIDEYQASLKKNEPKPKKEKKAKAKDKPKKESVIETAVPVEPIKMEVAAPQSENEEQSKIDSLMKEIGGFDF